MDRKYSDPEIWHISIDHDDAPDGSDGGYGKHGAYIPPEAMKEIVASRKLLIEKDEVIQRLRELGWMAAETLRNDKYVDRVKHALQYLDEMGEVE